MKGYFKLWLTVLVLALGVLVMMTLASQLTHATGPWYVAPSGNDSNPCTSPATACATINGAIAKANPGDTIYVASGTYTGTGAEVVMVDKSVTLSGGWNSAFAVQIGTSAIDGEGARRGINVGGVTAVVERFIIEGGSGSGIAFGNGIWNGGILTLNQSTVSRSLGGIFNAYGCTLTLNHSTVCDNTATGIVNNGPMVILNNSTISGNTGDAGGGIGSPVAGTVILNNSTVSGNRATAFGGGGIYTQGTDVTLSNSTITNNTADYGGGGGIHVYLGTVTLQNTIIAGNVSTTGYGPDCAGQIVSAGYNLIGDTSDCYFALGAGDLANVNAHLGPLIGASGMPRYHPLLPGSSAVDAGKPAGCTDHLGNPLLTDQRGAARVGRCDIGAYEYTIPGPAANVYAFSGTPQHAPPVSAFKTPFQALVLDHIGSPVNNATVMFSAPTSGASGTFSDTGSYTTNTVTADSGLATAATFTANGLVGSYTVTATVSGVVTPATFLLSNMSWYVVPGGNDSNNCQNPSEACATINGALNKPDFIAGDTVLVATGAYTSTGDEVVLIDKDVALSGGWDSSFTTQNGISTIDGEGVRRGVMVNSGVTATMERFAVQNGTSPYYGGDGILNRGSLILNNSTISGNAGIGIYNDNGTLTLNNSTVNGNMGSGILNGSGSLTLNSSTVRNNTTEYVGGGIYNESKSTVILNNSTVSGNTANGSGGGIENRGNSTLTLNNSTISSNAANPGGGISIESGTVTLNNIILAGNTAGSGPDCSGSISSGGYNLIKDTSGCTFTPGPGDVTNVSPHLGPLIGAPGVPMYHPLLSGSPAIDAGNPAGCTDHLGNPLYADQRGAARVGRCDIGAYEYTTPGPAASVYAHSGTPQHAPPLGAFQTPLQAAVLDGIGSPVNNAVVAFFAPASGASGTFADIGTFTTTAVTNEGGVATAATFTANELTGSYTVTAAVGGVATPANFLLGNTAKVFLPCVFRNYYYCPDFFDDFSNPASGWEVGEDEYVRAEYLNGEYRVLTKQSGYVYLFRAPICHRQNYAVEVDARWVGTPGASYGLIFGITGDFSQFYLFDVNTDYQVYWLLRSDPSGWVSLVGLTYSPAIHSGTASNHLKVTRNGSQITLEVNGTVLGTWQDSTISGLTGAGLASSPYDDAPVSDARFDNFRVTSLTSGMMQQSLVNTSAEAEGSQVIPVFPKVVTFNNQ